MITAVVSSGMCGISRDVLLTPPWYFSVGLTKEVLPWSDQGGVSGYFKGKIRAYFNNLFHYNFLPESYNEL